MFLEIESFFRDDDALMTQAGLKGLKGEHCDHRCIASYWYLQEGIWDDKDLI